MPMNQAKNSRNFLEGNVPPIVTILIVLAIAVAGVLMITSRNAQPMTDEQAGRYAKILRILVPVVLIGAAIRYFFF